MTDLCICVFSKTTFRIKYSHTRFATCHAQCAFNSLCWVTVPDVSVSHLQLRTTESVSFDLMKSLTCHINCMQKFGTENARVKSKNTKYTGKWDIFKNVMYDIFQILWTATLVIGWSWQYAQYSLACWCALSLQWALSIGRSAEENWRLVALASLQIVVTWNLLRWSNQLYYLSFRINEVSVTSVYLLCGKPMYKPMIFL